MIIRRSYRLAAICLMTAALLMSTMSGAIASADSEGDATSGASQDSSSSGSDATADRTVTTTTVSGTGADQPSSTLSAQTNTSTQTADGAPSTSAGSDDPVDSDRTVTTTTVSGTGPDSPSSTLSAQTNTSTPSTSSDSSGETAAEPTTATDGAEDPPTTADLQVPTVPLSIPVDESPPVAASGTDSATADTPNDSDTAESAQLSASATTDTATSDVDTATTAAVAAAAPVAAPTLQYAIAYLLRTLATAVDLVDAIMQLPAVIRDALGIMWIAPGVVESRHALVSATTGGLLDLIPPPRLQAGSPGAVVSSSPVAVHRRIEVDGGIILLASLLPQSAAPVLAEATRWDRSVPGLTEEAVTAVAVLSIWALVYAALPGLGAVFSCGAVGVRIGYRQCSAGIALRTPELARFLRPGPIGVVRTGSLVSVHSRRAAVDRTTRHLERVA